MADQLNGLQIEPYDHHINILLDMKSPQAYQIQQSGGHAQTKAIFLPNARLPKAFQETGLPGITSPETGITASIQQSTSGVKILLHGSPHQLAQLQVRFSQPTASEIPRPQSPLALSRPPQPNVKGLYHALGHQLASRQAVHPIRKQPVPIAKVPQMRVPGIVAKAIPIATHPVQVHPAPVKPMAPQPEKVAMAPPKEVPSAQPNPNLPKIQVNQPEEEEEGYNLLAHAQEHTEEAPSAQGLYPPTPKAKSAQLGFSQAILTWVLVSSGLFLGLIGLAIGFALWFKKRHKVQKESFLESPGVPLDEFFESAGKAAPQPEAFKEYIKAKKPAVSPQPTVMPAPTPTPTKAKTGATPPTIKKREVHYLIPPVKTVSEAVKTSLGSKANPYLSTPFQMPKKPFSAQSNQRPRVGNALPPRPTPSKTFNQLLQS